MGTLKANFVEAQGNDIDTIFKIVQDTFHALLTKPGVILISVFLLLILWGPKGEPVFAPAFKNWVEMAPEQIQWRSQLLSFASGTLLLVAIPLLLIRLRFKESWGDYGLGVGNFKLGMSFLAVALIIGLPLFYFGAKSPQMWQEYPLIYKGLTVEQIQQRFHWRSFLFFELIYASFFFVIEFTFRGYMLFGLREKFGFYAILIQMLSYTAWHLPKPFPELIGTPLWGFAVAAVTLRVGSVWYVFLAHWLLNIFLDTMILVQRGVIT